ncbi:unnamed protein product [Soboliphyme baturini]|uniref:Serine/arginine repetitive matrix protein 2-like n=1 Tax=Soboliphyme baturini TaxID=241478 RepID=A0A183J949_9BILA|nr:unnamed protein product [Soboliphyme baturini]
MFRLCRRPDDEKPYNECRHECGDVKKCKVSTGHQDSLSLNSKTFLTRVSNSSADQSPEVEEKIRTKRAAFRHKKVSRMKGIKKMLPRQTGKTSKNKSLYKHVMLRKLGSRSTNKQKFGKRKRLQKNVVRKLSRKYSISASDRSSEIAKAAYSRMAQGRRKKSNVWKKMVKANTKFTSKNVNRRKISKQAKKLPGLGKVTRGKYGRQRKASQGQMSPAVGKQMQHKIDEVYTKTSRTGIRKSSSGYVQISDKRYGYESSKEPKNVSAATKAEDKLKQKNYDAESVEVDRVEENGKTITKNVQEYGNYRNYVDRDHLRRRIEQQDATNYTDGDKTYATFASSLNSVSDSKHPLSKDIESAIILSNALKKQGRRVVNFLVKGGRKFKRRLKQKYCEKEFANIHASRMENSPAFKDVVSEVEQAEGANEGELPSSVYDHADQTHGGEKNDEVEGADRNLDDLVSNALSEQQTQGIQGQTQPEIAESSESDLDENGSTEDLLTSSSDEDVVGTDNVEESSNDSDMTDSSLGSEPLGDQVATFTKQDATVDENADESDSSEQDGNETERTDTDGGPLDDGNDEPGGDMLNDEIEPPAGRSQLYIYTKGDQRLDTAQEASQTIGRTVKPGRQNGSLNETVERAKDDMLGRLLSPGLNESVQNEHWRISGEPKDKAETKESTTQAGHLGQANDKKPTPGSTGVEKLTKASASQKSGAFASEEAH